MTESSENVFGKLSRIFETNSYREAEGQTEDDILEGIISEFGLNESYDDDNQHPSRFDRVSNQYVIDDKMIGSFSNSRPTPFDVWSSKQKDSTKGIKPVINLNFLCLQTRKFAFTLF